MLFIMNIYNYIYYYIFDSTFLILNFYYHIIFIIIFSRYFIKKNRFIYKK